MTALAPAVPGVGRMLRRIKRRLQYGRTPAELAAIAGADGWLSVAEAKLLYLLAHETRDGCVVEVGSYRGRATIALALGARRGAGAKVYTLDPHEPFTGVHGGQFGPTDRREFYRNMIRSGCYENVRLINLSSEVVTPGWRDPVALLWIDGDHAYEGVRRDFESWRPHLAADAVVVFDDSLDPHFGPARLIGELITGDGFERDEVVGKVTVLRRRTAGA